MVILAHRGYSAKFPENTLKAFKKGFEYGADGLELDLRLTADGELVVIHDEDLQRLFGVQQKIRELTLKQLRKYSQDGETIPTFEEVLSIIPKGKLLNAEFKEHEVAEDAIDLIEKHGLVESTIVSSFHHDLIARLIKEYPKMKFGFLIGEELRDNPIELVKNLLKHNPYSMHLPHQLADYPYYFSIICDLVKKCGAKIFIWTLDDLQEYERIKDRIDGVITNEVDMFVKHLRVEA
ncbi:MAG TPA: glycerophosphodiester phosphodiesterase family protein [Pseudothermotoga sp.]|nr:glycerophosphodiester phosphodiesterase family protein [Pseudothermotoga sp.]HOK84273.1 glycerophosphodiester phosphodiesterase family protein [Pseudothermotoga sp.]HPP70893.1 glycerophosphodiester phosphodiesterase family protein [Pseudothermotoga sp.]